MSHGQSLLLFLVLARHLVYLTFLSLCTWRLAWISSTHCSIVSCCGAQTRPTTSSCVSHPCMFVAWLMTWSCMIGLVEPSRGPAQSLIICHSFVLSSWSIDHLNKTHVEAWNYFYSSFMKVWTSKSCCTSHSTLLGGFSHHDTPTMNWLLESQL